MKANPEAAQGMDVDDIKTSFALKENEMICSFSVGGAPEMSLKYAYDGTTENEVSLFLKTSKLNDKKDGWYEVHRNTRT